MTPVDLLCADAWASNAGDVATALCTANGLAARGIPVCRVPRERGNLTIVGGGDLLTPGSLTSPLYRDLKSPCIYNAVGGDPAAVAAVGGRASLATAIGLSVRDSQLAAALGGEGARVAPCPATLIDPLQWDIACSVPRWGALNQYTTKKFIVVHARPECFGVANGAAEHVVAMESAPYTWTRWEAQGWLLPWTHAPELLASVIAKASAVVTLSLHMSIFALAVGTPFCVLDAGTPQTEKCRRYWERAGFGEVMYRGRRPADHALSLASKMLAVRSAERIAADEQLNWLASQVAQHATQSV
ncbi:MAG: polysaccharide pyruvyl transferase family protein [Planctomycetaceae bacterium]